MDSQVSLCQVITNKKKTTKSKPDSEGMVKKKKHDKEERHGMDIRECMALAADKARLTQEILTVDDTLTVIEPEEGLPDALPRNEGTMNGADEDNVNNTKCSFCISNTYGSLLNKVNNQNITNNKKPYLLDLNTILSVGAFLKTFTKNDVCNINISDLFGFQGGYKISDINDNILSVKDTLCEFKRKNTNDLTSNMNDNIQSSLNTPDKVSPRISVNNSFIMSNDSDKNITLSPHSDSKEDFFQLEDIFNEDDLEGFEDIQKSQTKANNLSMIDHFAGKEYSIIKLNNDDMKETGVLQNALLNGNKHETSHIKGIAEKPSNLVMNNIFKTPQTTKFTFQRFSSPQNAISNNLCEPSSPDSPILSGWIVSKNQSPSKLKRKALFHEKDTTNAEKNKYEATLSKPFHIEKENDISFEGETDLLSVSQLFNGDSDDERKKQSFDQSSMYTVSQMVEKVKTIATKEKSHQTSVPDTKNNKDDFEDLKFGCSDEDYLFDNIDLEALSGEKNMIEYDKNCIRVENKSNPVVNVETDTENFNNKNKISPDFVDISYKSPVSNEVKTGKNEDDCSMSSRWLSCMKSPFTQPVLKTSTPVSKTKINIAEFSDSDSNSDVFERPQVKKKVSATVRNKNLIKKRGLFIEVEADVSGPPGSSDEENTSGLDELDESFINDLTEHPSVSASHTAADIHAKYLQSVKSPVRKPGGFKIPVVSKSVLERDVFSQAVEEDDESYENDSFCCDATELPVEEDPSLLEIAEQILEKNRGKRKATKKRKVSQSSQSSPEKQKIRKPSKKMRVLSSDSSSEDQSVVNCKKVIKRKRPINSDSSSGSKKVEIKSTIKRPKMVHLLTSDSDSDRTTMSEG